MPQSAASMAMAGRARAAVSAAATGLARHFSSKSQADLKRVNPKVPFGEAKLIARGLSQILKDHGPLTVAATWNHVKEAGVSGLNSKTHMKILLKWMRGRNMLKLSCAHEGKHKKFLHSAVQEERRKSRLTTAAAFAKATESSSVN